MTGLPHWETIPADIPAATAEIKAAIRARIEASGRTVADVIAEIESFLEDEIADIKAARARGEEVWPVIDYADIAAGTVSADQLALLKRRGCAVVRGHFDRPEAEKWDRDAVDYVDSNAFFEAYTGPADDFFGSLGTEMSKPEIYPIYWSSAQMEARQHPRMATVQAFLNAQWIAETEWPPVVRSRGRHPLPRPDPSPPAGRDVGRAGHPPRPRHPRSVDDRGLPAALPPPVLR